MGEDLSRMSKDPEVINRGPWVRRSDLIKDRKGQKSTGGIVHT